MKRRTLLKGIGASTAMAVGTTTTASAMETPPAEGGATHVSVVDEGTRRLIPLAVLKDGIHSLDVGPDDSCTAECCKDCTCNNCLCGNCDGDGGGGC